MNNNFNRFDDDNNKIRTLCCCGPTGARGPTGPTGPSGGPTGPTGPSGTVVALDSILVDNDGIQTVAPNSLVDLGTVINSTGTSATFTAPNTVTLDAGTYYILYETLVSNTSTAGDVGASMLLNGTVVSNASEYVPATSTQTQIVLQHNATVVDGTTISINNGSSVSNNYHDSSLSIIKIG